MDRSSSFTETALPESTTSARFDSRTWSGAALILILISSLLLKLHNLDHRALKGLDESFHAVVAKNLIKHPLTPTLIDEPYLPYDYRDWQLNHVWLHKPIVPLWQMAGSLAVFGINTLALRLPSAILATAAVWLTYAIGRNLLGRTTALIGAALQAFNPAIINLVHGNIFSDHVDIALLFWVELSIYFLVRAIQSGRWFDFAACGFAQGLAFLCKTYPAFVVTGLAVVAYIVTLRETQRIKRRHLILLLAVTVVTIAPWTIYTFINFRREFLWEHTQVFRHLGANVEGWAGPWDRLVFDYSLRIYLWLYPAIIAASLILFPRAWRERNVKLLLIFAWGLGVLIPHVIATSKTPTATLIGWPPFFLLLGEMIRRAVGGDRLCLGAWFAAAVLAVTASGKIEAGGWGYPNPPAFAAIMRQNFWVLWHVLIAIAAAALFVYLIRQKRVLHTAIFIATLCTVFIFVRTTITAWRTTEIGRDQPTFAGLAALIEGNFPKNTVVLIDQRQKLEYVMVMFWIDRTAYPLGRSNWQPLVNQIRAHGGLPIIVSPRPLPLKSLLASQEDGLLVYDPADSDLSALSAIYPTEVPLTQ
jgi:4-amino-4-deoxy-L-arabinose transferase-like glycosyltransferase